MTRKTIRRPKASSEDFRPKEIPVSPVLTAFQRIWSRLFEEPIHLDSALSKLPPSTKSILAQILPAILLRPASQAEAMGVGVPSGEPWKLTAPELSRWRPASFLCERIHAGMAGGIASSTPNRADFPPQMLEEWEASFGAEGCAGLVEALGKEPPLGMRASRRVGPAALLSELKKDSPLPVRSELSDLSPLGIRLSGYAPVLGTKAYERGDFEIQDEGSQVMALFALWPERFAPLLQEFPGPARVPQGGAATWSLPEETPAWTVVDACAGAGGKSLAIADALKGKGRVFSYDTSEKKLQALRRRATRGGYTNIQAVAVKEGAEEEVVSRFKSRANVVLVDAPCSGWGVLRRNPDIKWRQTREVLERMPRIQARLLSQYSSLVMTGGSLVYGVCTFRPAETRAVVKEFLAAHPDFVAKEGGFLGPGPCDGFFMQRFEKRKSNP
ncbi:MAG: RsmB/NOP family class I SAM-dependent RNA methyltransferase [Oligoflexia bacterium]|nr:RsmB/NOP family class I SAM-dependent RNA methyltransferase [Oligoflexia bacterium]